MRHIFPNVIGPVMIVASMDIPLVIGVVPTVKPVAIVNVLFALKFCVVPLMVVVIVFLKGSFRCVETIPRPCNQTH